MAFIQSFAKIFLIFLLVYLSSIGIASAEVKINELKSETHALAEGDPFLLSEEEFTIIPLTVNVEGSLVRFIISKGEQEIDDKVVGDNVSYVYNGPEGIISFDVEKIFSGSHNNYVIISNLYLFVYYPPDTPNQPLGKTSGYVGTSYTYSTKTFDSDNDKIMFTFDWGDGKKTNTGFVNSGESISENHIWEYPGEYNVKVTAKDTRDLTSSISSGLTVEIKSSPTPTPTSTPRPTYTANPTQSPSNGKNDLLFDKDLIIAAIGALATIITAYLGYRAVKKK